MSLFGGIKITGKPDLMNVMKLDQLQVPMTMRMHQYGIAIDRGWFDDLSHKLRLQMKDLREEICDWIPPDLLDQFIERAGGLDDDGLPMNVNSRDQLSILLFEVLGIGAKRQLKTTKSGDRISTGKKQMEQLKREHPVIQKTLQYAELQKLDGTYCSTLPKIAKEHKRGTCWCGLKHYEKTYRVHTSFMWTRTDTGRPVSKSPNLYNIPARSSIGRDIRAGFIASPSTKLVASDWAQQEFRIAADLSSDPNLIRIFNNPALDIHEDTARRAFGLAPDVKPDKFTQRDPSKTTGFLVLYSGSFMALYDTLNYNFATAGMPIPSWLTEEWCKEFINKYLTELYPGIPAYWDVQDYRAHRYGIVWTKLGRIRRVPEVQSYHNRIKQAGLRQARNMPIQGLGADWLHLVLGELEEYVKEYERAGVWVWPVNCPYDEVLMEVEEDYAEVVKDLLVNVMESVMTDKETGEEQCRVPIKADAKISDRWIKG